MGTTRKPCKCCKVKCCAFGSSASLPFTPDAGWALESVVINNTGTQDCIGRAVADIVLTKPADPLPNCTGLYTGDCYNAFVSGEINGKTPAERAAIWTEFISRTNPMGAWNFVSTIYQPQSPEIWTCTHLGGVTGGIFMRFIGPSGSSPCPAGWPSVAVWKKTFDPPQFVPYAALAAFEAALLAEWVAAANAAYIGQTVEWETLIGGVRCYYKITCVKVYPPGNVSSCLGNFTYIPEPGFPYIFAAIQDFWLVFDLLCTCDPCDMGDYSWPLTLPCTCQSHYLDSDLTTIPPPCTLYLMSTSREYSAGKCLFNAKYGGAIAAGIVTCPPGTTDENCICCSEPAP